LAAAAAAYRRRGRLPSPAAIALGSHPRRCRSSAALPVIGGAAGHPRRCRPSAALPARRCRPPAALV